MVVVSTDYKKNRMRSAQPNLAHARYRVIRFHSNEVLANTEGVIEAIREYLVGNRVPSPPFEAEEGGAQRGALGG